MYSSVKTVVPCLAWLGEFEPDVMHVLHFRAKLSVWFIVLPLGLFLIPLGRINLRTSLDASSTLAKPKVFAVV